MNTTKRKLMNFDDFKKSEGKVNKEVKKEHDIVDKAYSGEKKGDKGTATLDENGKPIVENYEMDLDNGEMGYEHAKAVIDVAMEANKLAGGEIKDWDLQGALNKICDDNGIELKDDDRKEMIISSLEDILELLLGETKKLE